jgi:hypothetical protein
MDKTIAYDEPLDPHWERLNELWPSLDEILAGLENKSENNRIRHHSRENIVPFQTRMVRALEMRANLDRAIVDGHLEKFPDIDGVGIFFSNFAAAADELGYLREKRGGKPKDRDGLLELFHIAWDALRALERKGFPLMEYVDSPALDGPEIVGTLVVTKLPDGTIVSVKHEPRSNESGVS